MMETQEQVALYKSLTVTDNKGERNQVRVSASGCFYVRGLVEGVWGRSEIAVDDAGRPQWQDGIVARIAEQANVQFGRNVKIIRQTERQIVQGKQKDTFLQIHII